MELTVNQALKKGIEAHKAGQVQEADRYYTAIIKAQPNHPDANHNMGVLAVGFGKVEAALPFFKTALDTNPNIDQYWLSYINALISLGRVPTAKVVLNKAKTEGIKGYVFDQIEKSLAALEKNKKASAHVGQLQEPLKKQMQPLIDLYSQDKHQEALNLAMELVEQFPKSINLHNIIGAINQSLGRLDEAKETYKKVISLNPEYAQAYNNMGITLKNQGKLDEALKAYDKAIKLKPNLAEAYYNIGNALTAQGKLEEAIKAYNKAITLKPGYAEAYYNMGIALRRVVFTQPNKVLQNTIGNLLDKENYIKPNYISKAVITLLKLETTIQKHLNLVNIEVIESPINVISDLSEFPLLLKFMSVCPLTDLELEGLLANLRCSILLNISTQEKASKEVLKFQSALALQCFTNEYIYNQTSDEEKKGLKALEKIVRKSLKNCEQPTPQALLALASYKALNQYDWCNKLATTDEIKEVFSRQIEEPNHEEQLKKRFPILGEITDSISSKVRAQYEDNPYPRWVNLGLPYKSVSISNVVNQIKLKLHDSKITEVKNPEILIAGCGTGQHSIGTAARFKSAKILAIDLSLSSLAYAKRKTEELGIENIKYMQADILDLGNLDKQFDIIESVGVLHHMGNPLSRMESI